MVFLQLLSGLLVSSMHMEGKAESLIRVRNGYLLSCPYFQHLKQDCQRRYSPQLNKAITSSAAYLVKNALPELE
jgi:hypothetical protein